MQGPGHKQGQIAGQGWESCGDGHSLDRGSAGPASPQLGQLLPGGIDPQAHREMELPKAGASALLPFARQHGPKGGWEMSQLLRHRVYRTPPNIYVTCPMPNYIHSNYLLDRIIRKNWFTVLNDLLLSRFVTLRNSLPFLGHCNYMR